MESRLVPLLEAADKKRNEVALCLIGPPGIGKTQAVYEFARKHDRNVVEIIASQILPSEVSGITMPNEETHSMDVFDHVRLGNIKDGDIIFFDELLQAPQSVLSACLTLIQERRLMSGKKLPDVLIVAAANPLASPGMIPESIRQRFMFYDVKYDWNKFYDYIKETFGIELSSAIRSRIKLTGDTWNILTPRTLTKLIEWRLSLKEKNDIDSYMNIVANMFDENLADELNKLCKPTWVQALNNVASEFNVELDPETTVDKWFEQLQSSPDWPMIEAQLKNITSEDYNV